MKLRMLVAAIALSFLATPTSALQDQEETPDTTAEREMREKTSLPLEAARMLALDTDEGTWLSVDVSPDGQSVIFDLLGDLYTVPIGGGDANRITNSLAFDGQPRFSPDGTRVLFVSDRSGSENLWTLEMESGDTTQVTESTGGAWVSPDWTPDGEYVVASKGVTRLGIVTLWLGHVDGGSGKVLRDDPDQLKTVGAAVSPDGRYIWHAQRTRAWVYNAQFPPISARRVRP